MANGWREILTGTRRRDAHGMTAEKSAPRQARQRRGIRREIRRQTGGSRRSAGAGDGHGGPRRSDEEAESTRRQEGGAEGRGGGDAGTLRARGTWRRSMRTTCRRVYRREQRRRPRTRPRVQTRLRVAGRAGTGRKAAWVPVLVPPASGGVAFGELGNQSDLSFPSVPMGITLGPASEGSHDDWRAF